MKIYLFRETNISTKQFLRKMRITFLLIFVIASGVFALPGSSQVAKVSMSMKNATVANVIDAIEHQTKYLFVYSKSEIDLAREVSVDADQQSVAEVLSNLFDKTDVVYAMEGTNIMLMLKTTAQQAGKTITGKVSIATGAPLPGTAVVVKGTTTGVITDSNGIYSLSNLPANATLKFSFVGMSSQEIVVGNSTTINVTLLEEAVGLKEVVAVGYGTQKKITMTGAVSSIDSKDILNTKNENVQNMLAGKIPGVRVVQSTSEPGSFNTNLQIRGLGTPLVVIDGVPRDNMNRLDPNEIESISVLKDASAAVYGVRAANGVVLITTKKGATGKMQLDYNGTVGWQQALGLPKTGTATDYMTMTNENYVNLGYAPPFSATDFEPYTSGAKKSTDWSSVGIRKTAPQNQHSLSARGGSEKIDYFVNLGYLKQDGYWTSNDLNYDRFNVRSNVSAKISDRLKVELMINAMKDTKNQPASPTGDAWRVFNSLWFAVPTWPVYANDNPDYIYSGLNRNPLAITNSNIIGYTKADNKLFQGTFNISYDIPYLDGLKAKGMYSYDYSMSDTKTFAKEYTLYEYDAASTTYIPQTAGSPSSLKRSFNGGESTLLQLSLNYTHTFAKKHNVNALLLFEESDRSADNYYAYRQLTMDAVDQLFAGNSLNQEGSMDPNGLWKLANTGFVGRLNYDYLSRYIAEFSCRYDGSSKFASDKQWGLFPAVSVGWRLSEESFFKNTRALSFVNNLKLRASYGKLGDDSSSSYQFLSGYNYPSGGYVVNGQWSNGLGMRGMPNPNITWFTSKTFNLGIDADMWHGLLGLQVDMFNRNRDGLLATRLLSLPGTVGAGLPQENLEGDITKGLEFGLTHKNRIGELNYFFSGNISFTRTKWQYKEIAKAGNSYQNWTGNSAYRYNDLWWGYDYRGPFTSYAEAYTAPNQDSKGNSLERPGDRAYVDWNGDGMIDGNDSHPIATTGYPQISYGMTLGADFKGFDLNMVFQGTARSHVRYSDQLMAPLSWGLNGLQIFMDRWHLTDPNDPNSKWIPGYYPSTNTGESTNYVSSTALVQDASYLRLKSLEFGYTIPEHILRNYGIHRVRVYFSGYNLFTLTKVKYLDPEHPSDTYSLLYPISKTYNMGISLTF